VPPDELTVPGSRQLLERLSARGLAMFLASGTDLKYVQDELGILGLQTWFGPHVYGALDDYKKFSKAMIIEQMIRDSGVAGNQIVGFGGYSSCLVLIVPQD